MANREQRRAQEKSRVPFKPASSPRWADDVAIGYLHPAGEVSSNFARSLVFLQAFDHRGARGPDGKMQGGRGHFGQILALESGANIVTARNKMVHQFLTETRAEWLWMLDADMSFDPDALDRLLAVADKTERPIVGGLCFARRRGEAQEIVPTVYSFNVDGKMVRWSSYPDEQVFQVGGTGAACLLVHRRVFETMLDATVDERLSEATGVPVGTVRFPPPWPWFAETIVGSDWGDSVSEDLTFCVRAGSCGFPIYVDSRIKIGHQKPVVIDEPMFRRDLPQAEGPAPTFVVIPVKGKLHLTESIVGQLEAQGGFDHCFIYDNAAGTPDGFLSHGEMAPGVESIPAAGLNIHQMWNAGIKEALSRVPDGRCNIVPEQRLELGPDFLTKLAEGLRAHPSIAAVSGNYDNREFPELVQAVKGIAAGREDGTGGFAGFAFMVRGELWTAGCPLFDEELNLWYGDTAFTMQLDAADASYGIVRDAHVVHIGGGSQTSGDGQGHRLTPELAVLVEEDRKTFERKYLGLVAT